MRCVECVCRGGYAAPWSSSEGGTLGGIIALAARAESVHDVLALAPGSGNRRTGVQNSSDDYDCMGQRKILFDTKAGRRWPNAGLSERAKCTREYVLRQFRQSFVDDGFDLEKCHPDDGRVPLCHCCDGYDRRLGRIQIRSKHVDLRNQLFAMGRTTCRIAFSSNSGPFWKP